MTIDFKCRFCKKPLEKDPDGVAPTECDECAKKSIWDYDVSTASDGQVYGWGTAFGADAARWAQEVRERMVAESHDHDDAVDAIRWASTFLGEAGERRRQEFYRDVARDDGSWHFNWRANFGMDLEKKKPPLLGGGS
jgi:hypothetical protein